MAHRPAARQQNVRPNEKLYSRAWRLAEWFVGRPLATKSSGSPYFTFFGRQSFFFFDDTYPQSLQRKSPGLALRIGFPFWQDMARSPYLSKLDGAAAVFTCRDWRQSRLSRWSRRVASANRKSFLARVGMQLPSLHHRLYAAADKRPQCKRRAKN
jgi:hypothetical protein